MTAKAPATQATIRRAIAAARREGLHIWGIKPDGTVIVGERPIPIDEVLPAAPESEEQAEHKRWVAGAKL